MNIALNRDCMEVMKEYPDGYFDLAVVDPPYGINITGRSNSVHVERERERERTRIGGAKPFGNNKNRRGTVIAPKIYHSFDDQTPPNAEYFSELERVSKNRIIWGGNYFLDYLSSTPCLICWDKCREDLNFADGEFAWTSFKTPARIFRFRWNGMLQGNMKNKEERIHPTQKPKALYDWIFQRFAKKGMKILDTHLGSGSSRLAAFDAGLDFVGCEIDKFYFDKEEERFANYIAQANLFTAGEDPAEQIGLWEGET